MNTDKIAIGLLLTVHAIAACVAGYLIVRDFIRKHRRGLTPRATDAPKHCICGGFATINDAWCEACFPDTGRR